MAFPFLIINLCFSSSSLTETNYKREMGSNNIDDVENQPNSKEITIKDVSRRPDIDCIRVGLTWGILLFHTVAQFTPGEQVFPPAKHPIGSELLSFLHVFKHFMVVWNMPMFFFLSGISSYFALSKRNEQQYRDERVHRLLVPWLSAFLYQWVFSITYFAPNCKEYFESNRNGTRISNCPSIGEYRNISFPQYFQGTFPKATNPPLPSQAWFLLPLFYHSQMFAHIFTLWHPKQSQTTSDGIPCCGRSICCSRPFSCVVKVFSCISCFGKPASTSAELVVSTVSWLGSWLKLGCLPGIVFGFFETAFAALAGLRLLPIDMYYGLLYNFFDPAYPLMIFFGYTITAADDFLKPCLVKGRWIYLSSGVLIVTFCAYCVALLLPLMMRHIYFLVLVMFLRGFSKWLIIIGIYGVTRNSIRVSHPWLDYLRVIAMPFYLVHMQVQWAVLSGILWVPYLGSFPVALILCTIGSGLIAHVISKLTNFRYFFGLKPSTNSFLPGKRLRGFIPVLCLAVIVFPGIYFINR